MKKLLALSTVLLVTACGTKAPFSPPQTFIYTDIKAPLSIEYKNTDFGRKVGTAESSSILGLVSTGDVSVKTAAAKAGIKVVKHVDYSHMNWPFFIYQKTTVTVYGD